MAIAPADGDVDGEVDSCTVADDGGESSGDEGEGNIGSGDSSEDEAGEEGGRFCSTSCTTRDDARIMAGI